MIAPGSKRTLDGGRSPGPRDEDGSGAGARVTSSEAGRAVVAASTPSAKSAVTAESAAAPAAGVPHAGQNRAPAGTSAAQVGQERTGEFYRRRRPAAQSRGANVPKSGWPARAA